MQDIRKPYSHSKSNRDIASRVEEFEHRTYAQDADEQEAVHIPIRTQRARRNLDAMDMYPRRSRESDRPLAIDTDPHTSYRGPRLQGRVRKTSLGTWAFIITLIVVVFGVFLLTFVFNSAKLTITPKYQDLDVNKSYVFSNTGVANAVPYTLFTATSTKTKSLPLSETKKVEAKASGNIVVYNNFDENPQKLIKNTRFESSNGKIYRINESITVPGKKGSTPGSIEVTVYADSYGADYNIAPSDFTIPGFKGTPRFEGFFARSNGPMRGGASGEVSLVSQSDLNAAKDSLAIELAQDLKTNLQKVTEKGKVPLYSAIQVIFSDNEVEVMTGTTSTYEVTATGYVMLADETQLAAALAKELRDYPVDQALKLAYTDEMVFTLKKDVKAYSDASVEVLIEGKPRVVWVTDETVLKEAFVGKDRSDAAAIVQNTPSVNQIEMSFFPLWLSSLPSESDRISIVESLPKR